MTPQVAVLTRESVINPAQRHAVVGIRTTVGLTSRAGTIPESLNQDTIGTFGKTVRDAVYALDAIYGVDHRDKSTLVQQGKTPSGGYAQFLSNKTTLQGAVFGLPWASLWSKGDPEQISQLMELLDLIKEAGATVINGTELPHHRTIIPPTGWDWDYGSKRGYPNESEYGYIKVDFYNDIKDYLAQLDNTSMRSLEDLVAYNSLNAGSEGGHPGVHPAFASGQDGFEASVASKGVMDETYWQALAFCRRTTREEGIDAALRYGDRVLDGLLVPMDIQQSSHVPAQAGYPVITIPAGVNRVSGMPYGLALFHSAFSESTLVKYASAIEDMQIDTNTPWKRTHPEWREHLTRNIPIIQR